jgi:Cu/Ag efflux protein CusF
MKHTIAGILAVGLLLGAIAVTSAKPGTGTAAKTSKLEGSIAEIDATAGSVSIQSGIGAPMQFKVPATATIMVASKKSGTLNDLKVGDKVTVTYTSTTTELTLVRIAPVTEQNNPLPRRKK